MRWWRRPRNFALGQMAGAVLFIGAGFGGLVDPSLLGGRTFAIIALLLGLWSAALARISWSAYRRSSGERGSAHVG
jgi:hypothetical protein